MIDALFFLSIAMMVVGAYGVGYSDGRTREIRKRIAELHDRRGCE